MKMKRAIFHRLKVVVHKVVHTTNTSIGLVLSFGKIYMQIYGHFIIKIFHLKNTNTQYKNKVKKCETLCFQKMYWLLDINAIHK